MVPKKISYLFYLWPVIMISQGWENLKIWKETLNCRTHIANDVNDKFCREFFHWNMWRAISEKKEKVLLTKSLRLEVISYNIA